MEHRPSRLKSFMMPGKTPWRIGRSRPGTRHRTGSPTASLTPRWPVLIRNGQRRVAIYRNCCPFRYRPQEQRRTSGGKSCDGWHGLWLWGPGVSAPPGAISSARGHPRPGPIGTENSPSHKVPPCWIGFSATRPGLICRAGGVLPSTAVSSAGPPLLQRSLAALLERRGQRRGQRLEKLPG